MAVNSPATSDPSTQRAEIDRRIESDPPGAVALLREFWSADPSMSRAPAVVAAYEKIRTSVPLTPCRLAILRSFTVETMTPLLRAMAFDAGIDLSVQVCDFNTYPQDILDPKSSLYSFKPDVVILAAQSRDVSPPLWNAFADLGAQQVNGAIDQASASLTSLIGKFRQQSSAAQIVHNLQLPPIPAAGTLDAQEELGQREAFAKINRAIAAEARKHEHVYVLDYDALVARHGDQNWHDERLWLTSRMPIKPTNFVHLTREWMKFLHPLTGRVAKVLAVDLDNTLWGGVIGEDGMNGIKVGADYPGVAFVNLQRALIDLHRRGILLAVCSKNNPADAMEALEKHPGMLLRPANFAAIRANWDDKASNLKQLATDLNLGIDSIAFLDDNPVERNWIRSQLPQVMVIDLPADPMRYAQTVRDWPVFERLRLTEEDRKRSGFYAQERQRDALQSSAASLEDFLLQLKIRISIERMNPQTLPRIAQLTQKTNQFNLSTRRYSEGEMAALGSDPSVRVYGLKAEDRFGDNGLVGVAIIRTVGESWDIDTLLLSCRVIGRTIETAFVSHLAAEAKRAGAARLTGAFIPTKKNAPAKDFFANHGFARVSEDPAAQTWELPLSANALPVSPEWIEVNFVA